MENEKKSDHRILAIFLLILTTVLWGTTFILTKNAIQEMPIFLFLGLRFLFALLIFLPFLYRYKNFNKVVIKQGFITGFIYFLSIAIQTIGLQTTTAGKGGFITGLNTVIVPFMAWIIYKKQIPKMIWVSVTLSVIGMALLMLEGESGIIMGDIYVLLCAFGFALYIIYVDKNVAKVDIYLFLIIQLIVVSGCCFLTSLILQEYSYFVISAVDEIFWYILIYLGCIAAGVTFLFQNWGQKQIGPSQTAIIFTLEPVMALLFASIFLGNEVIGVQAIIGCVLIFIAILMTVIKTKETEN